MIQRTEWKWYEEVSAGYLNLEKVDNEHFKTEELRYPNLTLNVDLDEDGNVLGLEVLG